METATIVCYKPSFKVLKEYIKSNFPTNKIILWQTPEEGTFTIPGHYITIRLVPHFYVSPPAPSSDGSSGFWRYAPIPRPWHHLDLPLPFFTSESRVGFINIEQLSDKDILQYNKRYIIDRVDVYDYSIQNISLFGRGVYLPYKITKEETIRLKKFLNVKKMHDVCMICMLNHSQRRTNIVNQLKKMQIDIDIIDNIFGDERDIRVGQSRILLNVHMYDKWNVYESIRCERWRAAGMTIISEKSSESMPAGIIEAPYEDIVDTVISTIAMMKSH
jgi:hypothetical protein